MSNASEAEATIARLSSHKGVKGILILSSESGKIIRYHGTMLEDPAAGPTLNGDTGDASSQDIASGDEPLAKAISTPAKRYAAMVRRIVENSKQGVEEVDEQVSI